MVKYGTIGLASVMILKNWGNFHNSFSQLTKNTISQNLKIVKKKTVSYVNPTSRAFF